MRRKAILLWVVYVLVDQGMSFPRACGAIVETLGGSPGLRGPLLQHRGYRVPPSAHALEVRLRRFQRSPAGKAAFAAMIEQGGPPRAFVQGLMMRIKVPTK